MSGQKKYVRKTIITGYKFCENQKGLKLTWPT